MGDFSVGQNASFSKTITKEDVYEFAKLSGDYNPVHLDEAEAEKSIFKKRVAHGMLCASLISTVLGTVLPGKGTIYLSQDLKFCAPVYLGDTLRATVTIKEIQPRQRAVLDTFVENQNGKTVISGEAKVILPDLVE